MAGRLKQQQQGKSFVKFSFDDASWYKVKGRL
jgi:hypothetical protein